ncbi:MAG: hypothetical protein VYB48_02005 [Pseudomonadota bacterium]|nr:hypothetical protein [Pseudomonadota bacterium]MEC8102645.1 hypothetical protein [Pseudomonadota bacterium]
MFVGKVLKTKALAEICEKEPLVKTVTESFQHYWLYGFHPDIGRDLITYRPNPPEGHRHAHIIPINYPKAGDIGYSSGSEKSWSSWANALDYRFNIPQERIPTSDSALFYFVDTERTAYLFHFSTIGAHKFMNTSDFTDMVHKVELGIEKKGKTLMPWKDQHNLFSECWVIRP